MRVRQLAFTPGAWHLQAPRAPLIPEAYDVQGNRIGKALVTDREHQQLAEAEQHLRDAHRQQFLRELSDPTH